MIKLENTEVHGFEPAIRGMRNPMNSWDKSDSLQISELFCDEGEEWELSQICGGVAPIIGENDHDLMMRLAKAGTTHSKYRRMISVYVDITAPLYWWKEFDTYKVGTVANSCSTMHKVHEKEFTFDDFSHEHFLDLNEDDTFRYYDGEDAVIEECQSFDAMYLVIECLNFYRKLYLETKDKKYWWQMIQLLPSSYNQKRTVMLNYEVLANIYNTRKDHKLDEWRELCEWIKTLPYSEIITLEEE